MNQTSNSNIPTRGLQKLLKFILRAMPASAAKTEKKQKPWQSAISAKLNDPQARADIETHNSRVTTRQVRRRAAFQASVRAIEGYAFAAAKDTRANRRELARYMAKHAWTTSRDIDTGALA